MRIKCVVDFYRHRDWPKLTAAAGKLSQVPLYIDDTPAISAMELRAKARRLKANHDIQIIVLDYLQLMRGSGGKSSENRQQEISEISRSLKALARELSIPVIALSQLSRRGGISSRPSTHVVRFTRIRGRLSRTRMWLYFSCLRNTIIQPKKIAGLRMSFWRNKEMGLWEPSRCHLLRSMFGSKIWQTLIDSPIFIPV